MLDNDRDSINPEWDPRSAAYHYSWMEQAIIKHLPGSANSVLDIGCGFGHWGKFAKAIYPGAEITYLDVVQQQVQPIIGNICDFRNGQYDIIFAIGILHHIMSDKDLKKALKNIHAMLGTGVAFIGTRFDFLETKKERTRKFRTLGEWRLLLNDFNIVAIDRSNPPAHIKKHLDLMVVNG
jgi:SAM-dependent methyltransferase